MPNDYDAIVVGSGPNGLAAAITMARAGHSVLVLEANAIPGGGARSLPLTLPGFTHDICSAIHPLGIASPFFRELPLHEHGLEWIHPTIPLAHPLDDGPPALLSRDFTETGNSLDNTHDARAWRNIFEPAARDWDLLADELLGPMLHIPRHPIALARFGLPALLPASVLARTLFKGERARALFAGLAAHSVMPLGALGTSSFGLVLGLLGHRVGWPLPRGGSQRITDALISYLRALDGDIVLERRVTSLHELPTARAVFLDITPRQFIAMAGPHLQPSYRSRLQRFQYGPAVFKLDLALDGPIPWRDERCAQAGTVHVGGTLDELIVSERAAWEREPAARPFVLVAQQSMFDPTRAPEGKHTVWAYSHVPHGYERDMTDVIENQIERFAPGFRQRIIARSTNSPAALEEKNHNYVGGDIGGGANNLMQLLARPVLSPVPWRTPLPGVYLCSSSTPPGGGVHGMCGWLAARAALSDLFR
jgi:phytoene dehydrogenase-like protein